MNTYNIVREKVRDQSINLNIVWFRGAAEAPEFVFCALLKIMDHKYTALFQRYLMQAAM